MSRDIVISAQIRAGRALLDWSQEQLAIAANVSLSSVRDIEGQRRPTDTGAATALRRTLENEGIAFLPGDEKAGPGVRLSGARPNIIGPPTSLTAFEGMPFVVEWRGDEIVVFVAQEVLEDLERHPGNPDSATALKIFNKHRAAILAGVVRASTDPKNFDRKGRLHVRHKDIAAFD